jgi:hypothetical protein
MKLHTATLLSLCALLLAACVAFCQEQDREQQRSRPDDLARPFDLRPRTTPGYEPDIINAASFEFDTYAAGMSRTDLGTANRLPLGIEEEPDSFGPGSKIFIFRNRTPFILRPAQEVTFRLLVGNTTELYIWPESVPDDTEWVITVRQLGMSGLEDEILSSIMKSRHFQVMNVVPYTEIEFTVSVRYEAVQVARRMWLTVSPEVFNMVGLNTVMPRDSALMPE